jgi:hypothetical protein
MSKTQLKSSKTLEKVELSDVGLYLRVISQEYPDVKDYEELAKLISENFQVICTADIIKQYEELDIEHRDFMDRIHHAIAMGYIDPPMFEDEW